MVVVAERIKGSLQINRNKDPNQNKSFASKGKQAKQQSKSGWLAFAKTFGFSRGQCWEYLFVS